MTNAPFKPGKVYTVAATTTDTAVTIKCMTNCYLLQNTGLINVLVKPEYMDTYIVLTPVSTPGSSRIFSFGVGETFKVKTESSTATVYITTGEGI